MSLFFKFLLFFNSILVILVTVYEIKNFKRFLIWFFIVLWFPILGFIIYLIFGNALKFQSKNKLLIKQKTTKNYLYQTRWYKNFSQQNKSINIVAKIFKEQYQANLWHNNISKTFLNGQDFVNDLIAEIRQAKASINLEFYIFADDSVGNAIAKELIQKAKSGVVVNIIYDAIGSKKTSSKFWQKLKNANIHICSFFPNFFKLSFVNFKINYRNHRKIVIIDGHIGYIGGINIRDDHMGANKNLSPWRDTQVKLKGPVVYSLQENFLNDYAFINNCTFTQLEIENYFPNLQHKGCKHCQIIESGPEKKSPQIYNVYKTLINNSKKIIYIQSPYFIVNDEMLNCLINAKIKGVDVRIIIPKRPDSKLVWSATLFTLNKLLKNNIDIYLYNGFIHSKTLISDNISSIGSCNFDNRSFFLNFETTCLFYNKNFTNKQVEIFNNDINNSTKLTYKKYKQLKTKNIFMILIYKLIASLL